MNYKIKITAENQAIVKRIADENNMNKANLDFNHLDTYYVIQNQTFLSFNWGLDYNELTTEQFIKMFDKRKRMYSEEEVLQLLLRLQQTESYDNLYDWFQQFKKKKL